MMTGRGTDREKALAALWRWLPAFRTVAETESVTRASTELGVTPPAVSRAIQQLEDALDLELFERTGRQLILNAKGQTLLDAAREALGRLTVALDRLNCAAMAGRLKLAATGQLARVFLEPAARILAEHYPVLEVSIVHMEPEAALEQLENGELDQFLTVNVVVAEPLVMHRLGDLEVAIYAGRGHPLFERVEVSNEELLQYGFAAPRRASLQRSVWPSHRKRHVTLQTESHDVALEACLRGSHLMLMERAIAKSLVSEGLLREFTRDFLAPVRLTLCRHMRSTGTMQASALAAVRQVLRDVR